MLLASLESYWQPYLKALLLNDSMLWILGVTTAIIFSISILGSVIGKKIVRHKSPIGIYCILFILVYMLQVLLSMSTNILWFLGVFSLIYLLLGVLSVIGTYVLNKVAEDRVRTSMISLSSFSLQAGGVLTNVFAASLFLLGGIAFFWKVSALVGAVGMLTLAKPMLQRFPIS
jgi:predicted MFS family arabinose efflux permease